MIIRVIVSIIHNTKFEQSIKFYFIYIYWHHDHSIVDKKWNRYGDGVGMFRTHLFGVPSIIVYTPAAHKYVFFSEDKFKAVWPTVELMGRTSLVSVHGKAHLRVRNFVSNTINRPDALNRIAALVQPRMLHALQSWAQMGKINAKFETQKVFIYNLIYYYRS